MKILNLVLKKFLPFFTIIMLIAPLSGCLVTAFAIGASAGGAIVYDKRSTKTMLQDHNAAVTAQNNINRDPMLKKGVHISVVVFNHIALMVGQAQTPQLRERAYQWVASVPNISRIYNEVVIANPTSLGTRADDDWITTKVKTAMLAESGLHSTQIKVVTEDHVVYLLGMVSQKQATLAVNAARQVSGVQKIVKVFEYN